MNALFHSTKNLKMKENKQILIIEKDSYIKSILSYVFKQKNIATYCASSFNEVETKKNKLRLEEIMFSIIDYHSILLNNETHQLNKLEKKIPTIIILDKMSIKKFKPRLKNTYGVVFKPINIEDILTIFNQFN